MKTLILTLLLACGGTEAPHGHDHEGDKAHGAGDHAHDDGGHDEAHHDDAHHEAPTKSGLLEAPLGAYTARLEPSSDALKLVVVDAEGKPVSAEGEAKVMLTGTGEEPQRLVLSANGDDWTGPAKAEGAAGYVAVVSVAVGGHQETARIAWGEVLEAKPAPEPHDHGDDGHDHGSDHKH